MIRVSNWAALLSAALPIAFALGCQGKQRSFVEGTGAESATGDEGSSRETADTENRPPCQGTDCTVSTEQLQPADLAAPGTDSSAAMPTSANEDTTCVEGATESCGPSAEEGVCKFGTRACTAGAWGDCVGSVLGGLRDCSSAEDNDCDGQPDNTVDDVCRCPFMGTQPCEEHPGLDGRGPCRAGLQTCVLGADNATSDWGACSGSVGPQNADSCAVAGDDANCDGTPNAGCTCVEGAIVACGPGTEDGICQRGTSVCTGGAFAPCQGAVFPQRRDCRSTLDNDCDGLPDDSLDGSCTCNVGDIRACGEHPGRDGNGPCRPGQQLCEAGTQNATSSFGACNGSIGPALRDSCIVLGDDADCSGIPNSGCQCVAGQGNARCSGDPNNSLCNAQGACVPCQSNADCALVGGGRTLCNGGVCIAARCGDGVINANEECDDGNTFSRDGCSSGCIVERADGASCTVDAQCGSGRCLAHYLDEDGDGVAAIVEANRPEGLCATPGVLLPERTTLRPSGFQVDTDCCDTDSLVNGQFSSIENDANGCGHFDWDCSGVVETLYPNARAEPCDLIVVPDICNSILLAPGGPELCGQEIQITTCIFMQGSGCVTRTVTSGRDVLLCR
jgi:cysteine-rich repeat protein